MNKGDPMILTTKRHVATYKNYIAILGEDIKRLKEEDTEEQKKEYRYSLKKFESFIETSINGLSMPWIPDESRVLPLKDPNEINRFKGDMFEILAELFFRFSESNPRFGLRDYMPVALENDYGVDAYGINAHKDPCAVQVKYRRNPKNLITYTSMAKTYACSIVDRKIDSRAFNNLFLFTNAKDVSIACRTKFKEQLVLISREAIEIEIDNNFSFWEKAYKSFEETLKDLET